MRYLRCDVSTICVGFAASFGAFLLAGGTKGKRYALPNAEIMIHQPAAQNIGGKATDINIYSKKLQKDKARLNKILGENTSHTPEEIERDTDRDHFMTAKEALDYGIIDKIVACRD